MFKTTVPTVLSDPTDPSKHIPVCTQQWLEAMKANPDPNKYKVSQLNSFKHIQQRLEKTKEVLD